MFRIVATIIAFMAMILIVAVTQASDITLLPQSHILIAAAAVVPSVTEPMMAYSIRRFCAVHNISVPTYFKLRKQGLGPAEMRMGALIRISIESAAKWRQAMLDKSTSEEVERAADARRERASEAATKSVRSPRHISKRRVA